MSEATKQHHELPPQVELTFSDDIASETITMPTAELGSRLANFHVRDQLFDRAAPVCRATIDPESPDYSRVARLGGTIVATGTDERLPQFYQDIGLPDGK